MSYRRAIKSRKEEIAIMEKELAEVKDEQQAQEMRRRIEFVKSAIKGLEKLKKLG